MDRFVKLDEALAIFSDLHPLDYNGQTYLSQLQRLQVFFSGSVVFCKDCVFNYANAAPDPLDITEYGEDEVVCKYFQTDGLDLLDFCSHGKPVERQEVTP